MSTVSTTETKTELSVKDQATQALEVAVKSARTGLEEAVGDIAKGIATARGIREIKNALNDDIMKDFMMLMNSPHGFKSDKKDGGDFYKVEVVRDCMIDAFLKGAKVVNNEFNIIVGQCYLTKNFFERKIKELPYIRDLKYSIGTAAKAGAKSAAMPGQASWFDTRDGEAHEAHFTVTEAGDFRIVVNAWDGSSPSELYGKGESRLLRRIYKQMSGFDISDEPGRTVEGAVVQPAPLAEPKAIEAPAKQADPELANRQALAAETFKKMNVTQAMIEAKLGKPINEATGADLDELKEILEGVHKNETLLCDHFEFPEISEGAARNRLKRCRSAEGIDKTATRLLNEGADESMVRHLAGEYLEDLKGGE